MIMTPCRRDPAAWDLPAPKTPGYQQAAVARNAVAACLQCPALDACARAAAAEPPQHDCIQAAHVYQRCRRYTLTEFQQHIWPRRGGLPRIVYEQQIRVMYAAGYTDAVIGLRLGVTADAVTKARQSYGLFRARQLLPCGTAGAAARHRARGEPVDEACQQAACTYDRERNQLHRCQTGQCWHAEHQTGTRR